MNGNMSQKVFVLKALRNGPKTKRELGQILLDNNATKSLNVEGSVCKTIHVLRKKGYPIASTTGVLDASGLPDVLYTLNGKKQKNVTKYPFIEQHKKICFFKRLKIQYQ